MKLNYSRRNAQKLKLYHLCKMMYVFSIADPDPYWIRIQSGQWIRNRIRNPDPEPGGQKMTHKSRKSKKFHVWKCWKFSFGAEGFFCNLDVLYGGLGILFPALIFFLQFLVIKTLDPDWIRIGIQPKMLDPDQYQMNTDTQHCFFVKRARVCWPLLCLSSILYFLGISGFEP
jgi:hypothetical protein